MPTIRQPLLSKNQTGRGMYQLTENFYGDLGELAGEPLPKFFDRVRKYPYRRDVKGKETIARPGLLLKEFPAWDCKKKAIAIASWLKANRIPYRFIAVSETADKKIHHVFPQGFFQREGESKAHWQNLDATYAHYKMFQPKTRVTRAEVLQP